MDLFGVQPRFDDAEPHYIWGIWSPATKYNRCIAKATGTARVTWRGLVVRIPTPVPMVLESFYGSTYQTPAGTWRWDVEPFTLGSCSRS